IWRDALPCNRSTRSRKSAKFRSRPITDASSGATASAGLLVLARGLLLYLTDMRHSALHCQFHLFLPFACAFALRIRQAVVAVRAGNTLAVARTLLVFRRYRMPAGMASLVPAQCETMADRHPLVENETFALPQAFLGRHLLQIFEYAALQVVDLLETLLQHEG